MKAAIIRAAQRREDAEDLAVLQMLDDGVPWRENPRRMPSRTLKGWENRIFRIRKAYKASEA